jgi:hypothetical protein
MEPPSRTEEAKHKHLSENKSGEDVEMLEIYFHGYFSSGFLFKG